MGRDNNNAGIHFIRYSHYGKYDDLSMYDDICELEEAQQQAAIKNKIKKEKEEKAKAARKEIALKKRSEKEKCNRLIKKENTQNKKKPISKDGKKYIIVQSSRDIYIECEMCHKHYMTKKWYKGPTGKVCCSCFEKS